MHILLDLISNFGSNFVERISAKERARSRVAPIKCRDGTTVMPYACTTREEQLKRLQTEPFDVLVIGGGCVGAGVALDTSMRGLKTALIEQEDFGAGTSGRSTKLIHGGVRYLEAAFKKLDWGSWELVKEALEERGFMLRAAPYMNHPLPIMIPLYQWWQVPYMLLGVKVYDWLAGAARVVPPSHYLHPDGALFQFPMLKAEGLKGAIVYYDGQMNDTRMNLVVALTADQEGAAVANRVALVALLKGADGRCEGARVRDTLTGEEWEVAARAVVNCTGCFSDQVRQMDDPGAPALVVPSAGVHVMLPDQFCPNKMGLIVPETSDGRVLFFLPWEGGTLGGTTDSESEITMLPRPTPQEVQFILKESNRYITAHIGGKDVLAAWSGLRPLVKDPARLDQEGTKALSRNHLIEVSASKLVSVMGGKWTTYRRIAQDAVDRLLAEVPELAKGEELKCRTHNMQLIGADRAGIVCAQKFDRVLVTLRNDYHLPKDVADHLLKNYGTRALQVADIIRQNYMDTAVGDEPKRLVRQYPYVAAEVVVAVEQEYAVRAVDVLARRTRLAFVDTRAAREAAPKVVELMGKMLKWDKKRKQEELNDVHTFLETMEMSSKDLLRSTYK
mmetsp:Transcript_20488/g.33013  ORF Transcript_20488/g.33013 Transcript_20488/m.33013 type:complete len:617 (-) Transcript_20488:289-2139(-)